MAANVALAVGASPIMANDAREAPDLASLGGALVVNMGTVTPESLDNFVQALAAYNDAGRPVVLDPVGYVCIILPSLRPRPCPISALAVPVGRVSFSFQGRRYSRPPQSRREASLRRRLRRHQGQCLRDAHRPRRRRAR